MDTETLGKPEKEKIRKHNGPEFITKLVKLVGLWYRDSGGSKQERHGCLRAIWFRREPGLGQISQGVGVHLLHSAATLVGLS